ncbi:MAG TPA: YHS domain-containing (seleno)protein [Kofleriaceae bacterium]|jgi:YHS domain-containing protein
MLRLALALSLLAACGGAKPAPVTTTQPTAIAPTETAPTKILVNVDDEGVGIMGFDPAGYLLNNKADPGAGETSSAHGGATYWFANAARKAAFDKDPVKYSPQFGGYCVYAASQGRVSQVQPEVFEIIDGKTYLFTNPEFKKLFDKDPAGTIQKATENWPKLVEQFGTPAK